MWRCSSYDCPCPVIAPSTDNGYHAGEEGSEVSEVGGGIIVVSRYEARLLGAHLVPPLGPRV
jgi:hypothetical protein